MKPIPLPPEIEAEVQAILDNEARLKLERNRAERSRSYGVVDRGHSG
jgi:hypothetical protein